MMGSIFLLLILFQIKHWYIDFVDQTNEEVAHKGIYLDWIGLRHSLKQGLGTGICLLLVFGFDSWPFCVILGVFDFIMHYHIDWSKINLNKRLGYTIDMPQFWTLLGLDQLAHQITYIGIAYLTII